MDELKTARDFLAAGKYHEAGSILNRLIRDNRDSHELWYFLGILAVKLKNYDSAHEYLERAISLKKKPEYFWFKGMAYMETLEITYAIEAFEEVLRMDKNNVEANFFLSVCYLLLDDSRSETYMKRAYKLNRKKTKQLMKNFFEAFVSRTPGLRPALKSKIEKGLGGL